MRMGYRPKPRFLFHFGSEAAKEGETRGNLLPRPFLPMLVTPKWNTKSLFGVAKPPPKPRRKARIFL